MLWFTQNGDSNGADLPRWFEKHAWSFTWKLRIIPLTWKPSLSSSMPFDFNMKRRQQRGYHLGHKNITGLNHWKTRDPKFSTKSCQSCFHLLRRFSLWVSCVEYSWSPLECNWQGVLQRCHAKHIAVPRAYIGWKGRGAQGRWAWEVKRIIYSFVFFNIKDFSGFCKKAMGFGFAYSVAKFHPWKNWLCWSAILNEASTFWEVSQLIWNTPSLHTVHHQTLFQRLSAEFER